MKTITTSLIMLLSCVAAFAQTIEVKGTVNNQKGQPVPYAFVRDAQHNYATFADSTGTFMLKADPASALQVSASNYKQAEVKIDNKTNIAVVLPADAAQGDVVSLKSVKATINDEFLH